MEGSHAGAVLEGPQGMGRALIGEFCGGLPLVGGPHAGTGEKCEEEGAAEMKCYELTTTPTHLPPALFKGRR